MSVSLRLSLAKKNVPYRVVNVVAEQADAAVVRQLEEIGFCAGERVMLTGRGWFGGDPLAIRVGQSKFALRTSEAACVLIEPLAGEAA